jgi:hypothetical protein
VVGKQVSESASIVGEWRGQTQFQAAEKGHLVEAAHSVVAVVLTFIADGKVSGMSPDTGCTLLGCESPGGGHGPPARQVDVQCCMAIKTTSGSTQ